MTNKNHKFIKLISIILCVCLIGGTLAGCGGISMLYHMGTKIAEGDQSDDENEYDEGYTTLNPSVQSVKHSKEDVEKYLEDKYPTWKFEEYDFNDESVYCGENGANGYNGIKACSSHWKPLTMMSGNYMFSVVCENGQLKDNLPQIVTKYTVETEVLNYMSDELKLNADGWLVVDDPDYTQTKMPLNFKDALETEGNIKYNVFVYSKSNNLKDSVNELAKWLKDNSVRGNITVYTCDYGPTEIDKANSNLDIQNSKEYALILLNTQDYTVEFK